MTQLYNETETLTITTISDGSGSATSVAGYNGAIAAYDVDYGSADGTTVLTFASVGAAADGSDRTLAVSAAGNTDGLYYPRKATTKAADGSAGSGEEMLPLAGRKFKVTAASAGDAKTILVKLILVR